MEESKKICHFRLNVSESERVSDVSYYISIYSAPQAIVSLIYFDTILIVGMQNGCIYLGESLTHCKLMLVSTDEDSPTKAEFSNSKSRAHLQTYGS